jgi:signal transduction histidine kinase
VSRIRWKLLASMLTVVVITLGASAIFTRYVVHEEMRRMVVQQARPTIADADVRAIEEHLRVHGARDITPLLDSVARKGRFILIVANARRDVLATSHGPSHVVFDDSGRLTIESQRGRTTVRALMTVPPIAVGEASLYIVPELQQPRTPGMLDRWLLATFAAASLVAVVMALLLSRRMTSPLERLTTAVQEMARGELPAHVAVRGNDEIARLARSFNAMADAVAMQGELRRRMVGDVAHELRTPLTNLRCEIEALQDGLAPPDSSRLASLHEEVVHLSRIVEDLQDLAVSDAGGLQLHRELFDLSAAVRATGCEPVMVDADPVRINQVVRNLVDNATRYGDRVEVEVRRDGRFAQLTVSDNGPGIPEAELDRVFERFYRADPSRTRRSGGAGLGLAIVKRLVELHGGDVRAENIPDGGARFTVRLPLAPS